MENKQTGFTNAETFMIIVGLICLVLGIGYVEFWLLLLIGGMALFFGFGSKIVRMQKQKNKSN